MGLGLCEARIAKEQDSETENLYTIVKVGVETWSHQCSWSCFLGGYHI